MPYAGSPIRTLTVVTLACTLAAGLASCSERADSSPVQDSGVTQTDQASAPEEHEPAPATADGGAPDEGGSASTGDGAWTGSEYFASEDDAVEAMLGPRVCELFDQPRAEMVALAPPLVLDEGEVTTFANGADCRFGIDDPTGPGGYGLVTIRTFDGENREIDEADSTIAGHTCMDVPGDNFGVSGGELTFAELCEVGSRQISVSFSEVVPVSEQREEGMRAPVEYILQQILTRLDRTENSLYSNTPP